MTSIDERVVSMAFENAKFEAGVAHTMATLGKLDTAIKNIGSTNGLQNIEAAANKVTLQGPMSALDRLKAKLGFAEAPRAFGDLERSSSNVGFAGPSAALDRLKSKLGFSTATQAFGDLERASDKVTLGGVTRALDTVGIQFGMIQTAATVAFGTIVSKATLAGGALAKSLSLGPLTQGFEEYSTNLNSIQTILANTEAAGTNLQDVSKALQELNVYSDQTIYNFSQMANSIGLFTAAGVDLDTSVNAIKGIANLAALSGAGNEKATHAMQQLSQAIAAGKVTMQDWISVRNAGMGGQVFQKALFDTAKAMGTITSSPVGQTFEEWKKAGNSFTKSLSETQKAANSGTSEIKKAQKDSAAIISDAQEAAAESVENASDRVKDAQKGIAEAATKAADDVAAATEAQAETTRQSGEKVKSALADVRDARQGIAVAVKQSAADVKAATEVQAAAVRQSAEDVKSALDGVVEARKRLAEAMKPPSQDELEAASDALKTAQLDQQDLAGAVTDAQLQQKRSAEDLAAAQTRLADIIRSGGSAEEQASAQRAVEDAQRSATDAADAQERALIRQRTATRDVTQAEKALQETQKKGTKDDENVKDARDGLTDATKRYAEVQAASQQAVIDAGKRVTEAQKNSVRTQKEAQNQLKEATKRYKLVQVDAQDAIADAAKRVAEVQQTSADSQRAAGEQLADAQKAQAKAITDSQKSVANAHEQAAERIKSAQKSLEPAGPDTWLTSDVLTSTLKQFTGDMTDAQLKAQGFTDEQIKAIQQTAKTAKLAATEVKTLKQAFDVTKESIGSGWSETFKIIFGDFKEAKSTFTDLTSYITGFTGGLAKARNTVLKDWQELGGRTQLIEGLKNAFEALVAIIKPIKEAFREIFPAKTGQDLFDLTVKFRDFMENLKIGPETAENLRRTFAGFFAILSIGKTIVGNILGVIFDLLGVVGSGSGGFLNFTGSIGDFLVALDQAISKGKGLSGFFAGLTGILKLPLELIKGIASAIGGMFGGANQADGSSVSDSLDKVGASAKPLKQIIDNLSGAWDWMVNALAGVKDAVSPLLNEIGWEISNFADLIANAIENADWDSVFLALQTTFLGGLFLAVKKAIGGGIGDIGGGVLENVNGILKGVTGNLTAMQKNLQADTLLKIASAIGVLAAGIFLLSTIDPAALTRAMGAVAVGMGQLVGALALLSKAAGGTAFLTMPFIAASLVGLAIAVTILAGAMKIFATMSWEDLAKGLTGVAGALTAVGLGTKLMGPGVIPAALAMIPLAIGINLLAIAVKQFATMSWENMGKGLVGVAVALGAVALGMSLMPPTLLLTGAGLIAVSIGLTLLSGAVASFGGMDLAKMGQGIIGIAAALVAIGLAILFIPPTIALQAAGLVILAIALTGIAASIALLGNMKVETLVKGIAAIAGALIVLGIGLTAMAGTLPGSIALLAAAAALAILAPTLAFLGNLKWSTIFKGLAAIALVLGTIAVVGLIAAPALLALGAALIPLGIGFAMVGAAAYLFAKALALLGSDGSKGIGVMVAAITGFIAILPTIVINFVKGLVEIIAAVAKLAPAVLQAIGVMLDMIIAFVIESAPQLAIAIGVLVDSILQVLLENTPKIVAAGFKLLTDLLSGISANISQVTTQVTDIIVKFLEALQTNAPRLTEAGVATLVAFLLGISNKFPKLVETVATMIIKFIDAVASHIPKITGAAVNLMIKFVGAIVGYVPKMILAGANILLSFMSGIGDAIPRLVKKGLEVAEKFLNGIADGLSGLAKVGFNAIIKFLRGLEAAIRENFDDLINAGAGVADAIIDGLVDQFGKLGGVLRKALESVFSLLPGWAKKVLGISSPSKVFMEIGAQTMEGFGVGIEASTRNVQSAMESSVSNIVDSARTSFGNVPNLLEGMLDVEPAITPVLDLSQVQKDAKKLGDLTNVTPITAAASFGQAAAISAERSVAETVAADQAAQAVPIIQLEQNNYSPEALSEIEIYRQTNNQMAQLKSVVGLLP